MWDDAIAMIKEIKTLEQEKQELLQKIKDIQKEIDYNNSLTLVKCITNKNGDGCGTYSRICDLEYIRTHYYIHPSGCTGGDYWLESEGNFICPVCGLRNRLYNRKEIEKLQNLFKNIKEEYNT